MPLYTGPDLPIQHHFRRLSAEEPEISFLFETNCALAIHPEATGKAQCLAVAGKDSAMYTIVAASQKGGSGKTTLSGHMAVEAERQGAGPIALIDTDPQGSLAHWWNARQAPAPHFVKAGLPDLEAALAGLERMGIKIAMIDTPPAITQSISRVVAHADLVLVPTRPSPHDLRAVGATVDIAERHGKPLIFIVNAATARARITAESAVALSQHGTVAPVTIHHRVDFAASMIDGRTVGEVVPSSQSAKEITELWLYIQERLSRIVRDPSLLPEVRPNHLTINALLSQGVEGAIDALVPVTEPPVYDGVEQRSSIERRVLAEPRLQERRVFGRRASDQPQWGLK
jgi:chromosome partitioning protein